MIIAIQYSRYAKRVVICIAVMLSACAPVVHGPIYEKEIAEPVWPASPSSPRLAYVMSFSGGEDLGIGNVDQAKFWMRNEFDIGNNTDADSSGYRQPDCFAATDFHNGRDRNASLF